ncbi:hypothetical protein AB4027_05285 [Alkalibacterium putridalgicola]|uniref:hypothetical protein n=1 Tax=Alkalibacterium putridalgicola TaxID=426703 RepID=UPI0034CF05EC
MPIVYLIETKNHTVLSHGIRMFSKYPFNHLSISLDATLSEVYSFGRQQPLNPLMAGFAKEDFSHPFYKDSFGRVYALTVSEEEWITIQMELHTFESDALDWHYNLLGLVPAYFHYSWDRPDHFFCSEFIATLLQTAGILSPDCRPSLMHPKDVIAAVYPTCVYDGKLQQYPELVHPFLSHTYPDSRRYLKPIRYVYRQLNP